MISRVHQLEMSVWKEHTLTELAGSSTARSYWRTELSASFSLIRYATLLILLLIIVLTGCTNLKPVAVDTDRLQKEIRDGKIVHEGDTIRVITKDGVSRLLVVTGVDEHNIRGHATGARPGAVVIDIPIDGVLTLEEARVNAGETAAGSAGVAIMIFTLALIIAPIAVLSALGI